MQAARDAEAKVMRGDPLGPLHGVPFTAKDMLATRHVKTESGSHLRKGFVAGFDAPAIVRLEQAGGILVGKTTTSEFGWTAKGRSPLTGITRNPWRSEFDAGGSSAGAAAAAAAGMAPLHLANDGAGSIRIPAHFCGVFGFKPSFGLVPQFPVSPNDYTSHIGPITHSVADAALMLKAIAGVHPADHTSSAAIVPDYPALLSGRPARVRLAYSPDLGHARVNTEVAAVVASAVTRLAAALSVTAEAVNPAWGPLGPEIVRFFWPAHLSRFAEVSSHDREQMDPGLVACAVQGIDWHIADYQNMRERKYAYCSAIGRFFEDWDFLVTPVASVAAFSGELLQPEGWPPHPWDWLGWAEFSYPFNFAGNPAASIPCGFTSDGLPVGLQIVGRRFDDLGVLQVAAAYGAAHPQPIEAWPPMVAG
jgi:aspartyl-tRNA(Asn)/glutamyl-tRNA(Gln) amidotransferase subunit A